MEGERVRVDSRIVVRTFGIAIVVLVVGHLLSQFVKHRLGIPYAYGLVELFDMDTEGSFPTYFSGVQLLVCSMVLGLIGLARRGARDSFAKHWLVLAGIFLLLSADELVSVHELSHRIGWEFAPTLATGIFYWMWVVPGSLLVLLVSYFYAPFVFVYLPPFTRNRTILGATLFVGGAIGVEIFEALHVQEHGMDNLGMAFYVLFEETLEKIGILVFLSGILGFLREQVGSVVVDMVPG